MFRFDLQNARKTSIILWLGSWRQYCPQGQVRELYIGIESCDGKREVIKSHVYAIILCDMFNMSVEVSMCEDKMPNSPCCIYMLSVLSSLAC